MIEKLIYIIVVLILAYSYWLSLHPKQINHFSFSRIFIWQFIGIVALGFTIKGLV